MTRLLWFVMALWPATALALDDGLYRVAPSSDGAGVERVARADGAGEVALLPDVLAVHAVYVISVANDNAQFMATLEVDSASFMPGEVALVVGERAWLPSSTGSAPKGWAATATLSADEAAAVAAAFGVERIEREPLGTALVSDFATPRERYALGEPVPIVLTLTQGGERAVVLYDGGAHRSVQGPARDNRFSFEVRRDGERVEPRYDNAHFGGSGAMVELAPGAVHTNEVALGDWYALDTPGEYEVVVRVELSLHAPDAPVSMASAGYAWDEVREGTVRFTIAEP